MEKMCTAKTAIDNGYTTDLTMDENECITTEEFLGHFSKEHYYANINGDRKSNQLFPFADVEETKIILTPNIRFGNDEMEVKYNVGSLTNTFTVENVDADSLSATIRNDSNSGYSHNGKVVIDGNKVSMTLDENNSSVAWDYTVTLSGKRADGEGIVSESFNLTQWYRTIRIEVNNGNGSQSFICEGNDGTYLNEYVGINLEFKEGTIDGINPFNSRFESCKWTFRYANTASIRYSLSLKDENGKTLDTRTGSNISSLTLAYNDVKNCYECFMWIYRDN